MSIKKFLFIFIPLLLVVFIYSYILIRRSNRIEVVRGVVIHDSVRGYGVKTGIGFFHKTNWDFILSTELQHEGVEVKCVRRVADVIGMTPKDVMYDVQCTQIK